MSEVRTELLGRSVLGELFYFDRIGWGMAPVYNVGIDGIWTGADGLVMAQSRRDRARVYSYDVGAIDSYLAAAFEGIRRVDSLAELGKAWRNQFIDGFECLLPCGYRLARNAGGEGGQLLLIDSRDPACDRYGFYLSLDSLRLVRRGG